MMMGIGEFYLIPYGIALGANAAQIAFLTAIPPLVGALLQIRSAQVTEHIGSRTKLINVMVFLHASAWLPIILIPYVFPHEVHTERAIWLLLAAAVVFASAGAFAVPAWQSLMSDYIPVKKRGRYFGWRNRLQGVLMVTVSVLAGLLLDHIGKGLIWGFTALFTFAMLCRFSAWWCLTRMAEPFRKSAHDDYFSFLDFVKGMSSRNFARFVLFVSLMSLAANISGPLLPIFLLKDLGFDYTGYMIVVTTAALSGFVFQSFFGHFADREGNIRMIKLSGWGVALIPFLWLPSHHVGYLFFVQIFAGAVWGGFNMLVSNFMLEAVTPQKKIRCISYFNLTNTFASLIGASLGGWLLPRLPQSFGYSFLTLFLLSCAGRMLVMFFGSRMVKETRAYA